MKQGREFVADHAAPGFGRGSAPVDASEVRVVAACHHLPAPALLDLWARSDSDVLVCSDHPDAADGAVELLQTIDGIRALRGRSPRRGGCDRGA